MNRAGAFISNLSGEMSYQSFRPAPLPPNPPISLSNELVSKLIDANKKLSMLEGLSSRIPNIDLFVSMYVRKEALLSSQIEGTRCKLDDIFNPNIENNTNLNVSDVVNYIKATEYALNRLQSLPLCNRLIKETHAVLMEGVRGQEKSPGEFRYSQNWIGGQGSTIRNARYIPPNPGDMQTAMSDLEKYMNSDDSLDPLIQAALIHYQFETIHPFYDGNGRTGRIINVLYLVYKELLDLPILYLSAYIIKNKAEYYRLLRSVSEKSTWNEWIEYILKGIEQTAAASVDMIKSIDQAMQKFGNLLQEKEPKIYSKDFIELLFSYPYTKIGSVENSLKITRQTAAKYLKIAQDLGIFKCVKLGKYSYFVNLSLYEILKKGLNIK